MLFIDGRRVAAGSGVTQKLLQNLGYSPDGAANFRAVGRRLRRKNYTIGIVIVLSNRNKLVKPQLLYRDRIIVMKRRFDRISLDPAVMNGQPCIAGTRLTIRRVVEAVALYPDRGELKVEYPQLDDEVISQALGYAASSLDDEVQPLAAA